MSKQQNHRHTDPFAQSSTDILLGSSHLHKPDLSFIFFTVENMEGSDSYSSKRTLLPLGSDMALGKSVLSEPFTVYLLHLFRLQASGCHCVFVGYLSKVQNLWFDYHHTYVKPDTFINNLINSICSTSLSLYLSLHDFLCLVTTPHFSLNYFQLNHNPPFLSCLK